ncbi:hypothetical protein [Paenibacillus sonchi]|uniref:hypothetical protein n=1 Tax=Paenibacillus sonchi TaxID=373687 RepID=UPI00398B8F3C
MKRLYDNMTLAAALAPAYAVHGNHDYRANITLVDNIIRGSGVKLLQDESITIQKKGAGCCLPGWIFRAREAREHIGRFRRCPAQRPRSAGSFLSMTRSG